MNEFRYPMPESPRPIMTSGPETFFRYADVLTWFVENRGGRAPKSNAPVSRWIESLRAVAEGRETQEVTGHERLVGGQAGSPQTLASVCDVYAAASAAHAIQIMEAQDARGRIALDVHASFVLDELGARDHTNESMAAMPAGIGTLLLAAEAAYVGGGTVTIFGNKSKGLDVEWRVDDTTLRFEAKSRAFAAAFAAGTTREDLWKWAAGQVVKAAPVLRNRSRQDRVDGAQVVRLTAFLPAALAAEAHDQEGWLQYLRVLRIKPRDLPHAVLLHWLGLDAEPGDVDGELRSVADNRPHSVWIPSANSPNASERARRKLGDMVGNPDFGLPPVVPKAASR